MKKTKQNGCKGKLYLINNKTYCVGEKKSPKSKKSKRSNKMKKSKIKVRLK
jgi:hypothetical protein